MGVMRIYMLYDYEEYGADNFGFTLDPMQLPWLYRELWGWRCEKYPVKSAAEITKMDDILAKNEVGSFSLSQGWGGVVLVIAEPDFAYGDKWQEAQREAFRKSIGWYDRPENAKHG